MPRTLRFHLDESCDPALALGLRRRGMDVTTTQEEGLVAAPDPVQLAFAHAEGRALITQDADFVALHRAGAIHSGIFYCHQGLRTIGEMILLIELFRDVDEADEVRGRLEFL